MKRHSVYRLCMTALTGLLYLPAWAQFTLSGTIKDAEGGVLPGTAVLIEGTYKGTSADTRGSYRLTNLQAGTYRIRVSLLGFEPVVKEVTVNRNETESFELQKSVIVVDEVIVSATRVDQKSGVAYTNVTRKELEKQNLGQDIPLLLNFTPSLVTTSDAGAGVGYTGFRIRGSDATRVNVTVNGIPYNDAESQGTFWVNMPDIASSVSSIQIQRGVGTSTNGAGAFGASVNVQTNSFEKDAYGEVDASAGSFNTLKTTVKAGSGLLNNHFVVDARLSRIVSDGYIDRASSNLKSFYVSGGWYGKKSFVRLNVFSGAERTYQAWDGVPEKLLKTNRTYNAYTYENEVDNYQQDHYQLISSHELSRNWRLNASLHYTKGRGYYEQFREGEDFETYNLKPIVIGDSVINTTDLIRRRWLDNDFYGGVFSLDYNSFGKLTANIGGGWNRYEGKHFGEIIWSRFASTSNIRDRYYDNDAAKTDFNLYGKAFYQFTPKFNAYVDLQIRTVGYSFLGRAVGLNGQIRDVQQDASLSFFNPKAGLTYTLNDQSSVYASYGVGNREPNRDDYTQSSANSRPKAETLHDWEAGYRLQTQKLAFNANLYYMKYRNQLVLTGQINDVGAQNRVNVPNSYRLGIELEAGALLVKNLRWLVNTTLSQNKIMNFTEYVDNYDTGEQQVTNFSKTDISFSPNVIVGSQLLYTPVKGLELGFLSKFVGKQYLDNTSNENRTIDPYFVNDIRIIYTLKPKFMNEVAFTLLVNNVFGELYESNGYTYSFISESQRTTENVYYPQATANFLAGIRIKF
ncbi:TonB-dependent receptor [Tellurirhabdus bombi]|uniref:TonB-dependent receptor n=1 Tax=Tellurirhabdus bombi TaxID=2907205 RepID=UPI001F3A18D2|nr:TonB-dependent receptor [Tellurirhabdus bombi]